jgi:hypothetical protein
VESLKTHGFYTSYDTFSHCILASFPSAEHQKHGPGNFCPVRHPKSQKITKLSAKYAPGGSSNPIKNHWKRISGHQCDHWLSPWTPGPPKWCPRYIKKQPKSSKIPVSSGKSDPLQQSTCQLVTSYLQSSSLHLTS